MSSLNIMLIVVVTLVFAGIVAMHLHLRMRSATRHKTRIVKLERVGADGAATQRTFVVNGVTYRAVAELHDERIEKLAEDALKNAASGVTDRSGAPPATR